ncbi:MAG: TfoX/Sxy family protein [Candidatus Nanopelagicales bacterium]|nr:TfoX/Sxy family protein [Candidatus Nanopelagicales bacterium]
MSTDRAFVDQVLERLPSRDMRARPMFGEYGLYCGDTIIGLICDNTVFIKVTDAGSAFAGRIGRGAPYPGARDHLRISRARLRDTDWLEQLVDCTVAALPAAKPKRTRKG